MTTSFTVYKLGSQIIEFSSDIMLCTLVAATYFPKTISSVFVFMWVHVFTSIVFNRLLLTPYSRGLTISSSNFSTDRRRVIVLGCFVVKTVVIPWICCWCIREISSISSVISLLKRRAFMMHRFIRWITSWTTWEQSTCMSSWHLSQQ